MLVLPDGTQLGKEFRLLDVYESYDGPRLILCQNTAGQLFLGLSVEETHEEHVWLYVAISEERRRQIENGAMDLRTVFVTPEDTFVYEVRSATTAGEISISLHRPDELQDVHLPVADERLPQLLVAQILEESLDTVARVATQRRRETVRLALRFPDVPSPEAPSRSLGQILSALQELVAAAAQAVMGEATVRGRLSPEVLLGSELRVVKTYAGSFGIELSAAQLAGLFGDSLASDALDAVARLLVAGSDADSLSSLFEELKPRVAAKYRYLIDSLFDAQAAVHFEWGSVVDGRGTVRDLSIDELRLIGTAISEVGPPLDTTYEVVGQLVALNSRTGYFELEDRTERRRISGRLDPSRFQEDQEYVVNAVYRALVRETVEVAGLTGEEKISRTLLSLELQN